MPAWLAGWGTPTGWGLAGIFFLLVVTGRLVPVSTHRREVAAETRRAEDWKEAATLERTRGEIQAAKDDEILDLLRTLTKAPTGRESA